MIVVVETNFILELALQQPEAEQAETLLKMAEGNEIQLAIPAIAFAESYSMLASQKSRRNRLHQELRTEMKQMVRSQPYSRLEQTSKAITDALVSSATHHTTELVKMSDRIRACATVIPLTKEMTHEMTQLDLLFGLESGDAFIYASVDRYLKGEADSPRFFVTKDSDFEPTRDSLADMGCQLIVGFGAAIGAVGPSKAA